VTEALRAMVPRTEGLQFALLHYNLGENLSILWGECCKKELWEGFWCTNSTSVTWVSVQVSAELL